MSPQTSCRIAWSVALASLALWATSATASWGQVSVTDVDSDTSGGQAACPTAAPAPVIEMPTPTQPSPNAGTFHLCGPDPQAERAIEQLLAGRGFSASLVARGDGCADLTLRATGDAATGGSATNLSVSLGSGRTLMIQIVSERGATRASVGTR